MIYFMECRNYQEASLWAFIYKVYGGECWLHAEPGQAGYLLEIKE